VGGRRGEMTQTLYAHMNKRKKKERIIESCSKTDPPKPLLTKEINRNLTLLAVKAPAHESS
jgi:hypothetical protein